MKQYQMSLRGFVGSVEAIQSLILQHGGNFVRSYAFRDEIYVPVGQPGRETADSIRVRIYPEGSTPRVSVTSKRTRFEGGVKHEEVIFREDVANEAEAATVLRRRARGSVELALSFERRGWQYRLAFCMLFVEEIESLRPSVEVCADREAAIVEMLGKLGMDKTADAPVPELVRRAIRLPPRSPAA